MTALLFQLLKHGWQPLRELWHEGGVEEILFEQRNKAYGTYQLRRNEGWYLLTAFSIVISGVLSLGWASTMMESEETVPQSVGFSGCRLPLPPPPVLPSSICRLGSYYQIQVPAPLEEVDTKEYEKWSRLMHVMKADTDTVKIFTSKLDFEMPREYGYIESSDCFHAYPEPKISWLLGAYEPRPLNLPELYSQVNYPQLLHDAGIYQTIIFRILIDEDGQYINHEAVQGHPLALAEIEKYLPLLEFNANPLAFDIPRSWVRVHFRFEPPIPTQ